MGSAVGDAEDEDEDEDEARARAAPVPAVAATPTLSVSSKKTAVLWRWDDGESVTVAHRTASSGVKSVQDLLTCVVESRPPSGLYVVTWRRMDGPTAPPPPSPSPAFLADGTGNDNHADEDALNNGPVMMYLCTPAETTSREQRHRITSYASCRQWRGWCG